MKKIKIVFFDIDWTIYDHTVKAFNAKSMKAISLLQKNGIKVVICTSRAYHSVETLGLFAYCSPDGYITSNGSLVYLDGKYIKLDTIPKDDLRKAIEIVKKQNLTMECIEKKSCFLIAPKNEYVDKLFAIYYEDMPPVKDYNDEDVLSCLLFAPEQYDEYFIKTLPPTIKYYRFDTNGVDLSSATYKKGDGIKAALAYYGFTKEEAMAFGDDLADISMFEEVKYGIAMGNAKDEVKQAAFFVCENIEDNGVFNTLKKFSLI